MPLGRGIGEMWDAVRDRVELSGDGPTWQVTAGSFDSALAYARERFGEPAVLSRADRDRWWSRVTLTVTTDPALAASAPPLEDVAHPVVPSQPAPAGPDTDELDADSARSGTMPAALEAIFAHQEERRNTTLRPSRN